MFCKKNSRIVYRKEKKLIEKSNVLIKELSKKGKFFKVRKFSKIMLILGCNNVKIYNL